jgi:hypothetical protein
MSKVDRDEEKRLEGLSPFELKNRLIELAGENEHANALAMVNAGRGNPNWTATAPREAFFLLGQFAVEETRRDWDEFEGLGGMPQADGIAERLDAYLKTNAGAPGASALASYVAHGVDRLGFAPDAWVGELADAIIGDHYPVPDRMLTHIEQVVHSYLDAEMGGAPEGGWDLYAVEGDTAAMSYLFAPAATASSFGFSVWPTGAEAEMLSVKGMRDIVSGVAPLVLLAIGQRRALGWVLLCEALIPLADGSLILIHGGSAAAAFGIHYATAAVVIAAGILQLQVARRA